MNFSLADGFVDELEKLGGPRSSASDRSVGGLVSAFSSFSHHKRKAWANSIRAALGGGAPAVKAKIHNAAARRQLRRAIKRMSKDGVVDAAAAITVSLVDELSGLAKHGGMLDWFRPKDDEKIYGDVGKALQRGIAEDAERKARGEAPGWRRIARRLLAFVGGGWQARGADMSLGKQLPLFPGTAERPEIRRVLNEMSARHDPGSFWWAHTRPPQGVLGRSDVIGGKKVVTYIPGRLGVAMHEGGHHAARARVPGMDTEVYRQALALSQKYGWLAGLGLLPSAILDDSETRPALSKWGPALAMLPSLPTLAEETAANVFGGMEAVRQGHGMTYATEAMPGYGRHILRAATVPAGLWMVNKMREKERAAEEKAQVAHDAARLQDVSRAAL